MDLSAQLKSLSHHAYCIVGAEEARAELISILEKKHKIPARGNPDFFDRAYDSFGIDDARAVKSQAETRPVHGSGKKIFILTMSAITSEAQNALLKLLEEPPEYAHIFLVLPSAHLLLPTVKSRLSMLDVGKAIGRNGYIKSDITAADKEAKEFLSLAPAKRLDFIKKFMEEVTKEKRPKQDAVELLNAIQEAVHAKSGGPGGLKANMPALEAIETARRYMNDRAPSLKMLLEYVALAV